MGDQVNSLYHGKDNAVLLQVGLFCPKEMIHGSSSTIAHGVRQVSRAWRHGVEWGGGAGPGRATNNEAFFFSSHGIL